MKTNILPQYLYHSKQILKRNTNLQLHLHLSATSFIRA